MASIDEAIFSEHTTESNELDVTDHQSWSSKNSEKIQSKIDRWEFQALAMERDFKEKISSKMKAAIIISMLPNDLQDALIQQADRYEDYRVAKEKIISIVEAKLAMRSPDEMDVDTIGSGQYHTEWESLDAVGKGGIYCYRCGGQGHIAAKCATPDPGKSKGKGGLGPQANPSKGKGKGKGGLVSQANPSKGKGKGDWKGFCSYCGKRGHTPRDCWTK